ncbi:MAG: hypothetical protein HUU37_03085, partial [Bdellovibrionales bacterium]|nr:hypothetical protein [Bdellovibrionales bacterium]
MKFRLLLVLVLSAALPGMVDRPKAVSMAEVHSTVRSKGVVAVEALALRETCASFRVKSAAGHFVEMAAPGGSCALDDAKIAAGSGGYDWSKFE